MSISGRLLRNTAITALLIAAFVALQELYDLSLRDVSFLTGWTLFAGMVALALYNVRKKLPFIPLVAARTWLQFHIYLGWIVVALFLLHASLRMPRGAIEIGLWALFLGVALSGILGLYLSRTLPNRLRLQGERIIYERIPRLRAELAREVEELATRSVTEISSASIAQYYVTRLQPFMSRPRNLLSHIFGSSEAAQRLSREMAAQKRYVNQEGREVLEEISWRVSAKDDLDQQYALQLLLKGWLFVHIPLTYALILLTLVHVTLVYAFNGGTL